MEKKPIKVAVSVLADISLGIYRTPANAIKELISNAFDADASKVVISTGYPNFYVITCRDDGIGLESTEFEEIMSKIGGSSKRKNNKQYTKNGRPIIGKIGIGILAVAQICKKFTLISSKKDSSFKFEAVVDFSELDSDKAKNVSLGSEEAKEIGTYVITTGLPEDPNKHYTKIILEDIDKGFRKKLSKNDSLDKSIAGFKHSNRDPNAIKEFVNWLSRTDVRNIPDYYRLIWELSITCPLQYFNGGPILNEDIISARKKELTDFNFSVEIDGLNLQKLILFPNSPEIKDNGIDYKVYPIDFNEMVHGKRLSFTGYIYHQRKSIYPSELRGLLIRVRNVAIGTYDKSLLNYPKPQGPRMSGISGEIYIMEGLEDALNVDRNSFRETDPHYIKLQEIIYSRLGGDPENKTPGIFSDITKRSLEWNLARKKNDLIDSYKALTNSLESITHKKFEIEISSENSPIKPIEINFSTGKIKINEQHEIFPRNREERSILEKILIAYEYSNEFSLTKESVRDEFYNCLRGLQK